MEHRPQRQGYSDLTEREEEGVPALETDEPPQFPDLGPSGQAGDYAEKTSGPTADPARREDTEAGTDRSDEGATSGGQRSGGDGGTSSNTDG